MNESFSAEILILLDDPTKARRLATMLDGPQVRVWLAAGEVPDAVRLDLILTDRLPSEAASREAGGPPERDSPGVIRIGVDGAADVHLPADVAPRELRLACRLLSEVVRLRRRERAHNRLRRQLAEEAQTDPLTSLPNRRAWEEALRQRADATWGEGRRLCLAILDLDLFKPINDAEGYAAGDDLLRAVGKGISESLRTDDFVARLGGDEFGLLLGVPDAAAARAAVDRVRGAIPSGLAKVGKPAVTASAGFHVAPRADSPALLPSPDAMFAAADSALRAAKRQGRDRTVGG
jgi:diguanylate cyclase (GGDEF)-like protein